MGGRDACWIVKVRAKERERERERGGGGGGGGESDIVNLLLPSCVVHVLMILCPTFSSVEMSIGE